MEEQKLGRKEDASGLKEKSKNRKKKKIKKLKEQIEEGGKQKEELTNSIMPNYIFLPYVRADVRRMFSISILRKYAQIGQSWFKLTQQDLEAYF